MGYAHVLIPHHQEIAVVENTLASTEGKHPHHQHNQKLDTSGNHNLISHENHFDEGFLDLLVCLISEVEHPGNDCNLDFYNFANPKFVGHKELTKTRFVAVFIALFVLSEQNLKIAKYTFDNDLIYQSPSLHIAPNRGPPSLS